MDIRFLVVSFITAITLNGCVAAHPESDDVFPMPPALEDTFAPESRFAKVITSKYLTDVEIIGTYVTKDTRRWLIYMPPSDSVVGLSNPGIITIQQTASELHVRFPQQCSCRSDRYGHSLDWRDDPRVVSSSPLTVWLKQQGLPDDFKEGPFAALQGRQAFYSVVPIPLGPDRLVLVYDGPLGHQERRYHLK